MWAWISDNPLTTAMLMGFLAILAYALWLRSRMRASKAHFALTAIATMASCSAALMAFLSTSAPIRVINAALTAFGLRAAGTPSGSPSIYHTVAAFSCTAIVVWLIYRLSVTTIKNWDGPVTVNVNELIKQERDASLISLAGVEAQRLIRLAPDPVASDAATNWQHKQSEAPPSPVWNDLARSLFEAAFNEVTFTDTSWRDRLQAWIGRMYISHQSSDTVPLALFVFDSMPNEVELQHRIEIFAADGADLSECKLFAVFDKGGPNSQCVLEVSGVRVEVWPRRKLLRAGLRLNNYARDLIRRFDEERLGGTNATLRDTFVEAHVHRPQHHERRPLSQVLDEWLSDPSRRHLAITGEYGQGKSTAMLSLCVNWARDYIRDQDIESRVPLLIELRGQNPAETDPLTFISAWAGRYGMPPKQLYNLIRAGDAVLIFEGFDELRNAGRAYNRHEHFNALWVMAYPGTKLIFTGRPNFFLDEQEKNRTLRTDSMTGAAGNAFTQLWELARLTEDEVRIVANGFGKALGESIMAAATSHPTFFEIVSRPSMLPVVATIWDTIERLRSRGYDLTGAMLLEHYLQAIYRRKEEEIERDRRLALSPEDASYLILPRQVREVFTLAVVWRMAGLDARNTISRAEFDTTVSKIFDDVFRAFQSKKVPRHIVENIRRFEERFREEPRADRVERVSNEIASAGIFVPDPAGGSSNLRLPHKQYYEYLIARAAWMVLSCRNSLISRIVVQADSTLPAFEKMRREEQSIAFFNDIIGEDLSVFRTRGMGVYVGVLALFAAIEKYSTKLFTSVRRWCAKIAGRTWTVPDEAGEQHLIAVSGEMIFPIFIYMMMLVFVGTFMVGFFVLLLLIYGQGLSVDARTSILFEALALVISAVTAFIVSFYFALYLKAVFPKLSVFVEIVAIRLLSASGIAGGGFISANLLYGECLSVISKSPKSKIVRATPEGLESDAGQVNALREFKDIISPIC